MERVFWRLLFWSLSLWSFCVFFLESAAALTYYSYERKVLYRTSLKKKSDLEEEEEELLLLLFL